MVLFIQRQNRIGCFQTSISQLSLLLRILCCDVYSLESRTLVVVIRRSCQLACPWLWVVPLDATLISGDW